MIYRYSYPDTSSYVGHVTILVDTDNIFRARSLIEIELSQAFCPHVLDPNKIETVNGPIIYSNLEKSNVRRK